MNESVEELLQKIHSSSNMARIAALKAFIEEKLMVESKEELLCRINKSSDDVEIEIAKWVLWKKNLDKSFDGLMKVIRTSSDEDKIGEAAALLGELGYTESLESLIELLLGTQSQRIRNGAALGLRELGNQRALEPLVKTIKLAPQNSSTLVYALEVLDCRDIIKFLVEIFISQPDNYMLRHSVFECIKATDLASVPKDVVESCMAQLREARESESERGRIKELQELMRIFE